MIESQQTVWLEYVLTQQYTLFTLQEFCYHFFFIYSVHTYCISLINHIIYFNEPLWSMQCRKYEFAIKKSYCKFDTILSSSLCIKNNESIKKNIWENIIDVLIVALVYFWFIVSHFWLSRSILYVHWLHCIADKHLQQCLTNLGEHGLVYVALLDYLRLLWLRAVQYNKQVRLKNIESN